MVLHTGVGGIESLDDVILNVSYDNVIHRYYEVTNFEMTSLPQLMELRESLCRRRLIVVAPSSVDDFPNECRLLK